MNWRATDLEDMIGGYILWGLFILACVACMIYSAVSRGAEPVTDWARAYEYVHAEPDREVRLFLKGLSTPNGEYVRVYVRDGSRLYKVGTVAFYGFNKSNFVLDLTPVLRKMPKPPSKNTKIILRAENGVEVKYDSISITPIFVSREPE